MPSPAATAHYTIPSDGILPGGRPQCFSEQWKRTILHSWSVSVVTQGYQLQWNHRPRPWKYTPMKFTEEEQVAVGDAVRKFLNSGIIERSPSQDKSYLSKLFTVKEPNKCRPILDCTILNQYIQCNHFKMEGVLALLELLDKNDYMCKIDLKDAYEVMPIHENSRDYLTFLHQGVVYRYKSLAFGLNVAPQFPIQFSRYDDTSSAGKNSEIKYQDLTTAEQQGTEILSMDSEHYWEDNCYDTGDWGSTPSCGISTERPSKSTQVTQQQLECTMSDKPEKSAGTGVVVKSSPLEKWPFNPTQTTNTRSNHLRRRFRLRLGTLKYVSKAGNIVRDSSRTSDSNSDNLQQLQRAVGLPPHSWNSEYNGRSP
ncbi:hypothetical protein G6F70_002642 [Rhizopus microsporus]|nr:hypothetical protein G6F71_008667 [Rhizopus microsporus]KAG1201990.1 hypothetical protein G6F70_002642 [Rhizopus microsporus]KAG1206622.1 hypothetical protein G6F69_008694 [Rhizopus microsporus]KAG1227158.1 hypothetical protein G6F67_008617 [Rhizopus microsporus]KAG1258920.1 hypothetical protein G6F68_008470 [Rhizopus microsporus]